MRKARLPKSLNYVKRDGFLLKNIRDLLKKNGKKTFNIKISQIRQFIIQI